MFARVRCLAVLLLLLAAVPAGAVVPSTMGYQGLLTNGGGNPLPSGTHSLAFSIYDVASGGAALWTETHASVPVTNGQFSVVLGSVSTLSTLPFDRPYWLGISVDGGAELSPRIELASSPYALGFRLPFSATQSETAPLLDLKNPSAYSAIKIDPYMEVHGTAQSQGGLINLFGPDENRTVQLWAGDGTWGGGKAGVVIVGPAVPGPGITLPAVLAQANPGAGNTGQLLVRGGSGRAFSVNGENQGTGNPVLYLTGAVSQLTIDTNLSGDASVSLPANSVGPNEMFGEPGMSQGMIPSLAIPVFPASISSIVSTTITIPTTGYVTVDGSAQSMLFGTNAVNGMQFQISQSGSGPFESNYMRVVGWDAVSTTSAQYGAMVTTRTYFLSAGTYTFHFIAQKTGPSGSSFMILPTIRATFLPTSYGTVTAAVSPGQETEFDHVEVVPGGTSPDGRSTGSTMLVDLRDLELRAARVRLDAERAERELAAARVEAEIAALEKRVQAAGAKKPTAEAAK